MTQSGGGCDQRQGIRFSAPQRVHGWESGAVQCGEDATEKTLGQVGQSFLSLIRHSGTFSRWEKDRHHFDETYFSRRICGIGSPSAFNDSKHASTMLGLPHR